MYGPNDVMPIRTFMSPHTCLNPSSLYNTNVGDGSIESLIKIMTSCPLKRLWFVIDVVCLYVMQIVHHVHVQDV